MSQHIYMLIIQILTTDCKQKHLVYDFFFFFFFFFFTASGFCFPDWTLNMFGNHQSAPVDSYLAGFVLA